MIVDIFGVENNTSIFELSNSSEGNPDIVEFAIKDIVSFNTAVLAIRDYLVQYYVIGKFVLEGNRDPNITLVIGYLRGIIFYNILKEYLIYLLLCRIQLRYN